MTEGERGREGETSQTGRRKDREQWVRNPNNRWMGERAVPKEHKGPVHTNDKKRNLSMFSDSAAENSSHLKTCTAVLKPHAFTPHASYVLCWMVWLLWLSTRRTAVSPLRRRTLRAELRFCVCLKRKYAWHRAANVFFGDYKADFLIKVMMSPM